MHFYLSNIFGTTARKLIQVSIQSNVEKESYSFPKISLFSLFLEEKKFIAFFSIQESGKFEMKKFSGIL